MACWLDDYRAEWRIKIENEITCCLNDSLAEWPIKIRKWNDSLTEWSAKKAMTKWPNAYYTKWLERHFGQAAN